MLDPLGWLEGLTASGIILSAFIFGALSFYHAKKLNAKLLLYAGLIIVFIGLFWLGPFSDFLFVLITGHNLEPYPPVVGLYGLLSYVWVAPAITVAMYLGGELIMPKKKWYLIGVYTVLGVIFEYFLWFDTMGTFKFNPYISGSQITDSSFNTSSVAFLLVALFLVSVLIFEGIGFLIKAKQATGVLKKKFRFLSLGFTIFVVCGALDALVAPGPLLGIIRGVMMTFALWMYLGLKA